MIVRVGLQIEYGGVTQSHQMPQLFLGSHRSL